MPSSSDHSRSDAQPDDLAAAVSNGDRRALGRAITLVESARPADRERAEAVLGPLLGATGNAIRLGLSGAPGAGKSSFIEAFGNDLIDRGHKVAVLAVDPSSARGGGAIMGDKTRMPGLARRAEAFIRPSPAGETVGGVARRTREAILLVEAAGFDVVLVETVGVGQADTAVADMVDMFLLLVAPGGGDELQGIKRGAMELADAVLVSKADGDLETVAKQAAAQYRAALELIRPKHPGWQPPALTVSAHAGEGLAQVWETVTSFRQTLGADRLNDQRRAQSRSWLWHEIREGLLAAFQGADTLAARIDKAEQDVLAGRRIPPAAARDLLAAFTGKQEDGKG